MNLNLHLTQLQSGPQFITSWDIQPVIKIMDLNTNAL